MINAVITGRLGADPEVKHREDGTVILSLNIASNGRPPSGGGEKPTTWVRASLFGARGEALAGYLAKGDRVCVAGTLEAREYQKDGATRTSLDMRANEVDLIQDRKDDGGGAPSSASRPAQRTPPPRGAAPQARPAQRSARVPF